MSNVLHKIHTFQLTGAYLRGDEAHSWKLQFCHGQQHQPYT